MWKGDSQEGMLFGSAVKGGMRPDSDGGVLIVTVLAGKVGGRVRLRMEVAEKLGYMPFEIHVVTVEYERWCKRFIDKYMEV
nr:hypothetical protein [Candidatus Bathyarchaeota archaeon]